MAKVREGLVRTLRAPGPVAHAYRSPRPALRGARTAVRIAVLTLAAKFVIGLPTAAVTGWVLTINPAATAAPWQSMGVSDSVMTLVIIANQVDMATFAVSGLAMLVAGLFVIRWQLAAVRNLPALGADPAGWSPLEAGVAWFVPVWNLFAPKQVFDQLWRSSEPGRPLDITQDKVAQNELAQDEVGTVGLPRILTAWWVLWVGATVLCGTVAFAAVATGTVASMLTAQLTSAPVCGALVGAGIYLRQIMASITRRQGLRQAELALPR